MKAPAHLSADMKRFWGEVASLVELELHHYQMLVVCCSAWDRAEAARIQIAEQGMTIEAGNGAMKLFTNLFD